MEVLSSSRSTVLSEFPDFSTKWVQQQEEHETVDFQFFPFMPMFVEVKKDFGFHLHFIKHDDNNGIKVARMKRMQIEKLYCAACPKPELHEIALGFSNGVIKTFNHKTSDITTKFQPETSRKMVTQLDYNPTNEYLSAVQDTGEIILYGLKTNTKLETINFDDNCTLCRFHPLKKFYMTAISSKGSVILYDIQAKRRLHQLWDCHQAPCKDVCIPLTTPDVMYTVGYDCVLNIFDLRKKATSQQIKCPHPLSTVAISDCGQFACLGNLKGELISYDLRNTKICIASKKVHDGPVIRTAFVPANAETSFFDSLYQGLNAACEERKQVPASKEKTPALRRDSFGDFLELHSYKQKLPSRFSVRRDSFDWELLTRRNLDSNTESPMNSVNESADYDFKEEIKTPNYVDFDIVNKTNEEESSQCAERSAPKVDSNSRKMFLCEQSDRRLNLIEEEKEEDIRYSGNNKNSIDGHNSKQLKEIQDEESDKENMLNLSNKELDGFLKLPEGRNSTPHSSKHPTENKTTSKSPSVNTQDLISEMQKLRTEINSKFKKLEFEIRYNEDCNKWTTYTQNFNLWRKQMEISEEIQASVDCLLQTDPFVNEFLRLQRENEQLKKTISELSKSK